MVEVPRSKLPEQPYKALVTLVQKEVIFMTPSVCDVYDVTACCIQESHGDGFFCACDQQYKINLLNMSTATGCSQRDFLDYITVKVGAHRGKIPKFRFESSWFRLVRADLWMSKIPLEQQAFLSCSIGMGQQSMFYLCDRSKGPESLNYLLQFASQPGMQIRQAYAVLESTMKHMPDNKAMAFTHYNAGPSARHVSEYGEKVNAVAVTLRNAYVKKQEDSKKTT
jgi:hypothetical protein